MNQFSSTFFGGYRREEVDEYVGSLVAQLEQMKKTQEEHDGRLADLKAECAKKLADTEAKCAKKLADKEAECSRKLADKETECSRKLSDTEAEYTSKEKEISRRLAGVETEYAAKEKELSQWLADMETEYAAKEKKLSQRLADVEEEYAAKKKEYAERLAELEVKNVSKDEGGSQRLADLQAEFAAKEKEYRDRIAELEEKLREQDGKYDAVTRIMVLAEQEANVITSKAYIQADEYRKQVENELLAKKREAEEEAEKAYQLEAQYTEAINRTCGQLTGLYTSLGELIEKMSADFPIEGSLFDQDEFEKDKRLGGYGSHIIGMKPRRPAEF